MGRDFTAKADIYLPLYIGDYMADTMHLSPEQHGIYMLLIMHYWRNGGAIKNDRNFIKNVCKSSWQKCEKILTEFFTLNDNHYHHKRIDKEIKKSLENKELRQEKAKKGAAARWQNKDAPSNAPSIPQAMPEHMLKQCPSPLPSSSYVNNTETEEQDSPRDVCDLKNLNLDCDLSCEEEEPPGDSEGIPYQIQICTEIYQNARTVCRTLKIPPGTGLDGYMERFLAWWQDQGGKKLENPPGAFIGWYRKRGAV